MKISDLKKGSSYDLRITARNHVGYGKPYQPEEPIVAGKRISEKLNFINLKKIMSAALSHQSRYSCVDALMLLLLIICLRTQALNME